MKSLPSRLARADRSLLAVVALAFATSVGESAFIPVLPAIRDAFDLSGMEAAAMLSAETLAMLAAAVPIGMLAGRIGSRRLLLMSAVLLPVSMLGHAVATGPALLLLARATFGLSFGILWTIGPTLAAGGGRGAAGTGRLIAASGAGWLAGPVLAGVLADATGWRAASVALAVVTVPLIPFVARYASPRTSGERLESPRLRSAAGLLRHNRAIAGAALVSALLGVVGGVSGLLVPLALAANGLSAGAIGLAFGISAAVWIAAAAIVGRLRAGAVHLHAVGLAVAVMAAAWLLPAFRLSTLALLAFLVVATASRSTINALNYAVGARASEGNSAPLVMGVMNLAWAATALVTPLLAGLAEGSAGVRFAFAATAAAAAGVALVLLLPRLRVRIAALPS